MVRALGGRAVVRACGHLLWLALIAMTLFASGCGSCGPSIPVLAQNAPGGPTGVKLTGDAAAHSVLVEWDSVPGATSYEIYWMDSPNGTPQLIGTTAETSFTHTGVLGGVGYYQIAARNANGLSGLTVPMPCDCDPEDPNPGPPVVTSNNPADGAADVPPSTTIGVSFSEPIDPDTLNDLTFVVSGPGGPVDGGIATGGSTVTFTPAAALAPGTVFSVTVGTGVADLAGEHLGSAFTWSFTTATEGAADTAAPDVFSNTPANGAAGVGIDTTVGVVFTEAMAPASLNISTFTVAASGAPVFGTIDTTGATAIFTPAVLLNPGTLYTATITTGATDLAGNHLVAAHVWSFRTAGGSPGDTTAPTVTATAPLDGASDVSVNTTVGVQFSEAMDSATLTAASFILQLGGSMIPGSIAATGASAVLTPASPLLPGTTYTGMVLTTAADLAGNHLAGSYTWTFTTAAAGQADTTSPTVVLNTPAAGASDVVVGTTVVAGFSEAMAPASVNGATFTLVGPAGSLAGSVDYSGTTAVFTPASPLQPGTTYRATVTAAATDLAGNHLAADFVWNFTTAAPAQGDTTPPVVILATPANGSTDVPLNSTVNLTFSEDMQESTVNGSTFTVASGSGLVTGSVVASGSGAVFTPAGPLEPNTAYTAVISTGATDLAGNALVNSHVWNFTTADDGGAVGPPHVVSTSPLDGAVAVPVTTAVSVVFNEDMTPASLNASSFLLALNGAAVPGGVFANGPAATFTPSAPLLPGSTYTATVTAAAADLNGNNLPGGYSWSFTTAAAPDTTAPAVTANSPASGAVGVPVGTAVEVTFSEDMAAASLDGSFTLTTGGSSVAGSVGTAGAVATFTPAAALEYNTIYLASVSTTATDLAGNHLVAAHSWTFKTGNPPDTTAPAIISTTPVNGATAVPVGTTVNVVFTELMDGATLNSGSFTLETGGVFVLGTVSGGGLSAVFTPGAPLAYSTTYTATVLAAATDLAGNPLAASYSWSFTTPAPPDTTAPAVIASTPASGASGVAVSVIPGVTFSEPIDPASLTSATFILTAGGPGLPGSVAASGSGATFTPASPLAYSTTYTLTVTTGAADLAGNHLAGNYSWSFTTLAPPDTTAPTVTQKTPAPGAAGVPVSTNATAQFSEPMDPASINTATFQLSAGGTSVVGTVGYDGTTAIFTPNFPLAYATTYTVTVGGGAKDLAGNALSGGASWSFTTGNAPDAAAPTIVSKTPGPNATGVVVGSNVTIGFSEALDPTTVNSTNVYLKLGSDVVPANVSYSGTTATITPSGPLQYNTTYTVKVKTGVADLAGNHLASLATWDFKTGSAPDTTKPRYTGKSPAPGATNVSTNASVKITFSEAIDPATVNGSTFTLKKGNVNVIGTLSVNGNVVTFTPLGGLNTYTTYTVNFTTGLKDLAGNPLQEGCTYTFKTNNSCN